MKWFWNVLFSISAFIAAISSVSANERLTQSKLKSQLVTLHSSVEDLSQAMASGADGEYFLATRCTGPSVKLVGPSSPAEVEKDFGTTDGAFLAKYGKDGDKIWSVGFKGAVRIQSLAAMPGGGVIVGGVYRGGVTYVSSGEEEEIVGSGANEEYDQLFVAELTADGKLKKDALMLPEPDVLLFVERSPKIKSLSYDEATGVLKIVMLLCYPVQIGSANLSYETPIIDGWAYGSSYLLLSMEWPSKNILSSFQISRDVKDDERVFGASEVRSLLAASDGNGGEYLARTFSGRVKEIDNLSGVINVVSYAQNATVRDSTSLILVERRDGSGKNIWETPLRIIVSNRADRSGIYRSDATVNYVSPIGDGSRFAAIGYFDAPLLFEDGTKLESAQETHKGETGYCTDVFVLIGETATGKILSKRNLGIQLAGYICKRATCGVYPLAAVLNGEDLILGIPFQKTFEANGKQHSSLDGEEGDRYLYNSSIANVSLLPSDGLAIQGAISLTYVGKVRIDGLAKLENGRYAYVGSARAKEHVAEAVAKKIYVNGTEVSGGIAGGIGDQDFTSIEGVMNLERILQVEVQVRHAECVSIVLKKNEEQPVTYPQDPLPKMQKGDKLTIGVSLRPGFAAADYSLLPVTINGKTVNGEYTYDGSDERIAIETGAYKKSKDIRVNIEPLGSAKITLKVAGETRTFIGEGDPVVTVRNGDELEIVAVTPREMKYQLSRMSVQGVAVGEKDHYTLPEGDMADLLRIDVKMQAFEFPVQFEEVASDQGRVEIFVDGKVAVSEQGKSSVSATIGSKVKVVAVPQDSKRYRAEIRVNGKLVGVDGEYTIAAADGQCKVEVNFVERSRFFVKVEVKEDITYGKVIVRPDGGELKVFEGDPSKYGLLEVYEGQKLMIRAEAATVATFISLSVAGKNWENGGVYEVPMRLPGGREELWIKATFERSMAVEANVLSSVALQSNLVSESLALEGSWKGELRYALYNVRGVELRAGASTQQAPLRIDIRDFHSGVYLLRVKDETGAVATLKVIKR